MAVKYGKEATTLMSENVNPTAATSETAAPAEESAGTAPANAEKRKFKIEDTEVFEDDLIESYKINRKVAKEFDEYRGNANKFFEAVAENPEILFKELGKNSREFYQAKLLEFLEQEAEESGLTPEQKELRELKKWREEQEKESKTKKELEEKQKRTQEEARIVAELDNQIAECFRSQGIAKPTVEMVADLAEQMLAEYKHSKKSLHATEALSRAKSSFGRRLQSYTNSNPEALLDILPQEYLDKIAEIHLSRKSGAKVPGIRAAPAGIKPQQNKIEEKLKDFFSK